MVEAIHTASDKDESRKNSRCAADLFSIKIEDNKSTDEAPKDQPAKTIENGQKSKGSEESDFETAIAATGYGKFNILLLLCVLPGFSTSVYVSSSLSYIMTSAECDLKMSMADMGRLNTYTYAGMLVSALMWGFLSDTLGRKKIMVSGFLVLAVCELIASQSQTYLVLSMAKFCAGFVFNGPFAILISYISEMHAASIRAKVLVYIGAYYSFGNMNLPLIAWGVIPQDWTISLFNGAYVLHSWQIFLALFSIPPLATGLALMLLPESPKFLMSRGRNDEALKIFKKMFSMNKGLPEDDYPIKSLVNERASNLEEAGAPAPQGWAAVKGGMKQLKPLILPPYLFHLILVCFIMWSAMLGSNTLRLWFPQMATIVEDYDSKHEETAPLCHIIESYVSNKTTKSVANMEDTFIDCIKMDSGNSTYINSVIIGAASLIAYLCGGFFINTLGKRKLSALCMVGSGSCALALYWSTSLPEVVTIFAVFVSITSLAGSVLSSIAVDLFPTSIRAMAVAVMMMTGRMGTVLGGITFPYLLETGCLVPFVTIAAILSVGGLLSLILPRTTLKKMD